MPEGFGHPNALTSPFLFPVVLSVCLREGRNETFVAYRRKPLGSAIGG